MADIPAAQQAVAGQDDHQQPHEALHQAEHDDAAAAQQGVAPDEAAAVVGAAAAEQQQAQPPAAGEDHHQQEQQHGQLLLQPLHQQQQQAQHQAGIAAAPAGVPPAAAAGPPVEAPSRPHFSYAPEEECDLVLCTSDGKRIGVHRLIVLRTCSLFKELLAACTGETEVAVAERYDEVKPLLLDIFYDRSVAIRPEMALQVFHLADKYEAPSLMQACRAVFLSDAFELGILGANTFASGTTEGQLDSLKGHASWIEMMSLASKHKYGDLVKRCVAFFLKQCQERPSLALESLVGDRALLPALAQPHLEEMLLGLAGSALALDSRTQQDLAATRKQLQESQAELEALKRKLEVKHSSYMKLLGKHNRLLDKCDKHQVTWHKDLEPPQKKAKK